MPAGNRLIVYTTFLNSLFIKVALFPQANLFFKGAWRSAALTKVSVMKEWFSNRSFVDKSKFVSFRPFKNEFSSKFLKFLYGQAQ